MTPLKYQIDRMRFRAAFSSSIMMMKDENFHQNKVARVVTVNLPVTGLSGTLYGAHVSPLK